MTFGRDSLGRTLASLAVVVAVTCPYVPEIGPDGLRLHLAAAHAQGGEGNGGGNGNGGGGGGGNGNGGGGNGNGGNGNGNGGGGGNDNGHASGGGDGPPAGQNAQPSGNATSRGTDFTVVYDNGMTETIQAGRYEMRDAQGRTIVNRDATLVDYLRMQ